MNTEAHLPGSGATGPDASSLVSRLSDAQRDLARLFNGQIDAVVDPTGQIFLLQEAQERLQRNAAEQRRMLAVQGAILDALPAHIAMLDERGIILSVNSSWRRFAESEGLPDPGAGLGSNYLMVCQDSSASDETAAIAGEGIRAVLAGEKHHFVAEYACHSPYQKRWFAMHVTPMPAPAAGAVVMHLDITARREAELKLEENEQRFRIALQGSPITVYNQDQKLRYTWVYNPPVPEKEEDFLGRTDHDLQPFDQALELTAIKREVMENRIGVLREVKVCVQGKPRDFYLKAEPLLDEDGQAIGVACATTDITEYRRAQRRIREQADLLDHAHDAITVQDITGRVLYWNRGAERLYGWTVEEVFGRKVEEFLFAHPHAAAASRKAVLATGEWNGELQVNHRLGTAVDVRASWTLVRDEVGRPKSILSISTAAPGHQQ